MQPMTSARPPSSQPGLPSPQPGPTLRRGYGLTVLLAALAGALFLLIALLVASASLLWLAALLMVTIPGGDPGLMPTIPPALLGAVAAVTVASLLLSVALDGVVTVRSVRRLDGRRGERAVPIISLVATALATVLPLLLGALLAVAMLASLEAMISVLTYALVTVLSVLAPTARLAQLVAGILRLRAGEPDPSAVPPLP